jgi:hypothetical protein
VNRPRFCGYCGEDLSGYDPKAEFCMNCGKSILMAGGTVTVPKTTVTREPAYSQPLPQRREAHHPSYPPYYRPPRQRIDYVPVSDTLRTFLTKPREINTVFQKTSWLTILLIFAGVIGLEFLSILIINSKVSLNLSQNFIDELVSIVGSDMFTSLGSDLDPTMYANMFISILPIVPMIINTITLFIIGIAVFILMSLVDVERELKNFRLAMTSVAFSYLPMLLLGVLQVLLAILYPVKTIEVNTLNDISILIAPTLIIYEFFNNIWLVLSIDIFFAVSSFVFFFWGVYRGLGLEGNLSNKAMILTLGYVVIRVLIFFFVS